MSSILCSITVIESDWEVSEMNAERIRRVALVLGQDFQKKRKFLLCGEVREKIFRMSLIIWTTLYINALYMGLTASVNRSLRLTLFELLNSTFA